VQLSEPGNCDWVQVVEMAMGMVDSALLERMAKIMSYVRLSAGGKPVKRLKRKDKLSILGIEPDVKANGKKLPPPPPLFAPAPVCHVPCVP
jgi:IK cytokine